MKIVTSEQMHRIEARSEQEGVATDALMDRAGLEIARRVRHHLGHLVGVPIVILVGPGNNGGDGLVAARYLDAWDARVLIYICRERPTFDPRLEVLRLRGLRIVTTCQDHAFVELERSLSSAHLIVDAVLGTGRSRLIDGPVKEVLDRLRESKIRRPDLCVLSIDMPTGLDADSGAVDPASPLADVTVALGYPKRGMFIFPGAHHVGRLEVVGLGIPNGLDGDVRLELMTRRWATGALPARPSWAHKGTFGRALIVAGSRNYIGAARLAAMAAIRVGAGLVAVALPESLQASVACGATEPTYLPLPESSPGVVSPEAASILIDEALRYDALLLGCGLGQASNTKVFVERLLCSGATLPPTVVDADGLNMLAGMGRWWKRFATKAIITPHSGEMARLIGGSAEAIQSDRICTAIQSAQKWSKVIVLKGAHTVVGAPDGAAMVSPFANPGLASAGTGDILAGAITGLLSQNLTLEDAAALGVYLHGTAGEWVRDELGDRGMVAGDLLPALAMAIRSMATPNLVTDTQLRRQL